MVLISMISSHRRKTLLLFCLVVFAVLAFVAPSVKAELSTKQTRKLLTRMPGFEMTSSSVRIKSISATSPATAEVRAEIRSVFKFEKDQQGSWRVAEIRTRPDQWEDLTLVANALGSPVVANECNAPDPPFRGTLAVDPSVKRVRCLLGGLLGVELPSDAVRIQSIAPFAIPLASRPSAVVVAWVRVDARLLNTSKGWQVGELRTGNHEWVKLEPLVAALNEVKVQKARTDLETIAKALELFRVQRGFYVVSEQHSVVIDHLNPRYLSQIIRVDPWHQPYKYDGQRDHFTLRSSGPDGKDNTADDIKLATPSR
jgi:type II secretion system (T2SS) protein G